MIAPALPANEAARLPALYRYDVLDTSDDEFLGRVTRIASAVANVPICSISLIAQHRQKFVARRGLDAAEPPRDISFCGHAILADKPLQIHDATRDARFVDNPLVTG